MKIGPVDLSIPALVYAGVLVAGLVLVLKLWFGSSDIRAEAWYHSDVMHAMYEEKPDILNAGAEACQSILASTPDKIHVRLYLACILIKQGQYGPAKEAFDKALEANPAATPHLRSCATIGSAVAALNMAGENKAAKAAELEPKLLAALQEDKDNSDLLVNLALIQMWKGHVPPPKPPPPIKAAPGAPPAAPKAAPPPPSKTLDPKLIESAEAYCKTALDPKSPPASRKATEQLYALWGYLLTLRNKPADAITAFDQAKASNPLWAGAEESRRVAVVASVVKKELDPKMRRDLLVRMLGDANNYGVNKNAAYIAGGIGYSHLKGQPDYTDTLFPAALKAYDQAIAAKDGRAYINAAALYEDRIKDNVAVLRSPVTGFNGETPKKNIWKDENLKVTFNEFDLKPLAQIREDLKKEQTLWMKYQADKKDLTSDEKINAKLRQLSCLRREGYLEADDSRRKTLQDTKMVPLVKELLAVDAAHPEVLFAKGQVELERSDYPAASKTFTEAKQAYVAKSGKCPPHVDRLIEGLSLKPTPIEIRPSENHKKFLGNKPVISLRIKALTSVGPYKKVEMTLNSTKVNAVSHGSQVMYMPLETEITHGMQAVKVQIVDAMGVNVEVPEFKFELDRKPPDYGVTPDNEKGAPATEIPAKPKWNMKFKDVESGLRLESVNVELQDAKKSKPRILVENGKIKGYVQGAVPGKVPFVEENREFDVTVPIDLAAGEYTMTITATDNAGNNLKEEKKYKVVKAGTIKVGPDK